MSKYLRFYAKAASTTGEVGYLGERWHTTNYLVIWHHTIQLCCGQQSSEENQFLRVFFFFSSEIKERGKKIVSPGHMPVFFLQGATLAYQSVIVKRAVFILAITKVLKHVDVKDLTLTKAQE